MTLDQIVYVPVLGFVASIGWQIARLIVDALAGAVRARARSKVGVQTIAGH